MFDLDKIREKIIALDETDAKNIVMLTVAYLDMVKHGKGGYTSENFVDELIKILNKIPEPDVLKEMYKKRQQEN